MGTGSARLVAYFAAAAIAVVVWYLFQQLRLQRHAQLARRMLVWPRPRPEQSLSFLRTGTVLLFSAHDAQLSSLTAYMRANVIRLWSDDTWHHAGLLVHSRLRPNNPWCVHITSRSGTVVWERLRTVLKRYRHGLVAAVPCVGLPNKRTLRRVAQGLRRRATYRVDLLAIAGLASTQPDELQSLRMNCVQAVLLLLTAGGAIQIPSPDVYHTALPSQLAEPRGLLTIAPGVHFLRPVLLDTTNPDTGTFVQWTD